jgi:hypothetical protein
MKFEHLLETVTDEPLLETGLLLAGSVNPTDVRRQLSRWVGVRNAMKAYPVNLTCAARRVVDDVRPLLAPGAAPDLLTRENVLRALT